MRLRFLQRKAALGIYQMLGVMGQGAAFRVQNGYRSFAQVQGPAHRVPDAAVIPAFGLQAVHYQLDEMRLVTVQGVHLLQVLQLPVDADLGVTAPAHLLKEFPVMTLSAAHQGREQVALFPLILRKDEVHNLLIRVADHFPAAFRRVSPRTLGVQQAQKVVDFRNGAHRAAGIAAGGFLLDGNDGAQAGNLFHLRLFQDAHEMLGVGGQGVHVAALTLRINGIEGKGAFTASAQPRHHHEFPARNIHADVLQVVGPGAPHPYVLLL